jgi:hypothetical protein
MRLAPSKSHVPSRRPRRIGRGSLALLVVVALLVVACDQRSSRDASLDASVEPVVVTGQTRGAPPPIAPPAPVHGVIGGDGMAKRRDADESRPQAFAASVANEAAQGAQASPRASGAAAPASAIAQVASSSMIIRNGWAAVEVDSLDPAIARVRDLAQRVGGYVANTSIQGGKDQLRSATIEVKVPSPRFDEALSGLAPIGKVESVNVSAEDVGEEYVDITARVENARRLEERLIALLANRTGRLQDVLSVERELARVREEIERYEGRLRFLRTRVATSTLTVNVHERAPIITPVAGDGPIVVALRDAWRNFVAFIAALIASLGIVVPLTVLVGALWIVVRRWVRPAMARLAAGNERTPPSAPDAAAAGGRAS